MPSSVFAWSSTQRHKWVLGVAAIFLLYIVVLLSNAYQSQMQLSRAAEARLLADSTQTSAVLGDFIAEQDRFALNLASGQEIQSFLTNRALGMSMRYGLGANMFAIEENFRHKLAQTKSLGVPVYERILFLDDQGTTLIDTRPGASPIEIPWSGIREIRRIFDVEHGQVITIAPVDYRGQPAGTVVTISGLDVFSRYLTTSLSELGFRQFVITGDGKDLGLRGDIIMSQTSARALVSMPANVLTQLAPLAVHQPIDLSPQYNLGLRTPIADTSLSLVTILPESVLYGHITSKLFLYLASVVPLILILGALWIYRIRERTLTLEAVVVESHRSRLELQDKNDLLTVEVARRVALENDLRASEERYRTYIENAPIGIFVTDDKDVFLLVNPAISMMTGFTKDELFGMSLTNLFSAETSDEPLAFFADVRRTGSNEKEITLRRRDGTIFVSYIRAITLLGGFVMGFCMDITQRKMAEEQIHNLAFFDPLTALPNRRLLLDRLRQATSGSVRERDFGALLMLDLDHFKNLNDTLGHDVGDQLLKEVARRLTACVRQEDTVSRFGGDEFVVILQMLGKDAATAAAHAQLIVQKIHSEVSKHYLLSGRPDYYITSSIGVMLFCGLDVSIDALLKQADVALYEAKRGGRNTVRFFSPEMQSSIDDSTSMVDALRKALVNKEFLLYFQPQVDSEGFVIGAEALLRWIPQDSEIISPATFIPVAEESGLIVPIGDWVVEQSFAQLKLWQQDPKTSSLKLSINVSADQFHQVDFVAKICNGINRFGINPSRITLELTESIVLARVDEAIERMLELRALGVSFSLDDFGTGYSSLSYLKQLPLDQVKIDGSFVRDISFDPNDAAIVRAILAMSHSLGLVVIAEGVETQAQREFLLKHGCTQYQGYLFGKPLPIQNFSTDVLSNFGLRLAAAHPEVVAQF